MICRNVFYIFDSGTVVVEFYKEKTDVETVRDEDCFETDSDQSGVEESFDTQVLFEP